MAFLFNKLEVYRKAMALAKTVHFLTNTVPSKDSSLADQVRRSSSSIPLNIAEGNGRWNKKDRRNLFIIARGSCFECVPALELLSANGVIKRSKYDQLKEDLEVIAKMLTSLIRNTR